MKSEKRRKQLAEKHSAKQARIDNPGGTSKYCQRDGTRVQHVKPWWQRNLFTIDELCAQWLPMEERATFVGMARG